MLAYLKSCKKFIESYDLETKRENILIITGNESVDMDSFVSSILFSYILFNEIEDQKNGIKYIIIINIIFINLFLNKIMV